MNLNILSSETVSHLTQVLTSISNIAQYKHTHTHKIKVKVKLSLCLIKHHAMKTYWGSGSIAPRIL